MIRRFFVDTEFFEHRVTELVDQSSIMPLVVRSGVQTIDLISLGVVMTNEAGTVLEQYYAENAEFPQGLYANGEAQWLCHNVVPKLSPGTGKQLATIREDLRKLIGSPHKVGDSVRFYGWYCAHDLVVLEQLMGGMRAWSSRWPMHMFDLRAFCDAYGISPPPELEGAEAHHALVDAMWTHHMWLKLRDECLERGLPCP